jgi:GNAT superfamily N-acetyltransferase
MMGCAISCCVEHGPERIGGVLNPRHYESCWRQLLTAGAGAMFLYEDNGMVVGGIGGAKYPALLSGNTRVNQLFIYVLPEYRGKIPIRRLMICLEAWAAENDADDILMPLIETMPGATRSVYERLGYRFLESTFRKKLRLHEKGGN